MLSIAGRKPSGNCANCRSVKRRCDKVRPQCGQCVRKGQQCTGYRDEWELVFRDQTKDTIQRSKGSEYRDMRQMTPYHDKIQRISYVTPGPMVGIQIFSSYLNDYFPRNDIPDFALDPSYQIISGIHMLARKGPIVQKAAAALSCIFLGKLHRDEPLLRLGIRLYNQGYNQGLYSLSKSISRKAYNADFVHYCPDSLNQPFLHIDGLAAISRLYCPQEGDSPIINTILNEYQKFRLVLSRFMYLSEPMVRLLKEPGEGVAHELIQLLTDFSCLAAAVSSSHQSDQQTRKSLLQDCLELERRHLAFYSQISPEDTNRNPPTYNYGAIKTAMPPTDDLFEPAYKFSTVGEANLHIFVWSSLSLIYPLLHHAYILAETDDIPKTLRIKDQSPRRVVTDLSVPYISKAIQCFPYCTQDGMNAWSIYYGMVSIIFASRILSQVKDWERFTWTLGMMDYMKQLGFELAARLHDMCWGYWYDPREDDFYMLPYCRELSKEDYAAREKYIRDMWDCQKRESNNSHSTICKVEMELFLVYLYPLLVCLYREYQGLRYFSYSQGWGLRAEKGLSVAGASMRAFW